MDKTASEVGGGSTPEQYEFPPGMTQLYQLIQFRDMNHALGEIFCATFRMGIKATDLYNINKILWYAQCYKDQILKEGE